MNRQELYAIHVALCGEALDLMKKKNQDYAAEGDPYRNFRMFGRLGILVRLSDKLSRLRTFEERGKFSVADESIRDTILDLINYAILYAGYEDTQATTQSMDELAELVSLHPMPDYGDLMTIDEFLDHVKSGGITNDDGSAYLACELGVTGIQVRPRDLLGGIAMGTKFTHVAWFNK